MGPTPSRPRRAQSGRRSRGSSGKRAMRGGSTAENGPLDEKGELYPANPITGRPWTPERAAWAGVWSGFPIYAKDTRAQVLATVDRCAVTIIKSATGSGKTVLTPAMLLYKRVFPALLAATSRGEGTPAADAEGTPTGGAHRVAVTTPKRVTTLAAAETAAQTLDVPFGTPRESYVSVEFRGSAPNLRTSPATRLTYFTDGTLLARTRNDPLLSDFDVVVVDEAHERPVPTDMLLLALRGALQARPELRVVIMSATIDTDPFRAFFEAAGLTFGVVDVKEGQRRFPIVRQYRQEPVPEGGHLEAAVKLAFELASKAPEEPKDPAAPRHDDILVFVPTTLDARNGCIQFEKMCGSDGKGSPSKLCHATMCAKLYSKLTGREKAHAIGSPNGVYRRKVVFATNIAESSITLEGLGVVIDTGLELSSAWDPDAHGTVLTRHKATRSQIAQRAGRVGRTAPGVAYLLYTEADHDAREEYPLPSITTIDFTDHVMQRLTTPGAGLLANARAHFASMLTPPTEAQMSSAVAYLVANGLLSGPDAGATVTPLGASVQRVADALRVTTASALLVHAGATFGCVDEAVRLAAVLESDTTSLWAERDPPKVENVDLRSDHVTLSGLVDVARQLAADGKHLRLREAGLNSETWRTILRQLDQWASRGALSGALLSAEAPPPTLPSFAFAKGLAGDVAPLVRAVAAARFFHLARPAAGGGRLATTAPVTLVDVEPSKPVFAPGGPPTPGDVALYESLVKRDGKWTMNMLTWVQPGPAPSARKRSVAAKVPSVGPLGQAKKAAGGGRPR